MVWGSILYYSENNLEALIKYSHIFQLNEIEKTVITTIDESVDYHPQYAWENNEKEGYYFYDEDEINTEHKSDSEEYEKSFYNEIKFRQYGDLSIDFPPHYLEDIEEFELAQMVEEGYLDNSLRLKAIEDYNEWIETDAISMTMKLNEVRGTLSNTK